MGIALADTAAEYGAEVVLVLGPVNRVPENRSVKVINVISAESMATECVAIFPGCDIAILAAAVADFSPEKVEERKIKRTVDEIILKLKPTKDIAETLGRMKKKSQILAGFALRPTTKQQMQQQSLCAKNLTSLS
jgi:phosphopantothenoylcysteine decarboxylase/phosphopantothenate--cysteine ligase